MIYNISTSKNLQTESDNVSSSYLRETYITKRTLFACVLFCAKKTVLKLDECTWTGTQRKESHTYKDIQQIVFIF